MKIPVKYSVTAKFERGCPYPTAWEVVERWSGGENRYPFATESEARLYMKQAEATAEREVREDRSFSLGCLVGAVAMFILMVVIDLALGR